MRKIMLQIEICDMILLYIFVTQSYLTRPHELWHTRLPCPSLSPRVCSNLHPLSQWYRPTISSFVAAFSSCPQSFPASGSFAMSRLFASGGQSIGASALASVLPVNIQGWFPLGLTRLILQSKGLTRVFSSTTDLYVLSLDGEIIGRFNFLRFAYLCFLKFLQ